MFRDRRDAGRQVAELLEGHDIEPDVVLAVPRGGLPVGRAVADALGVPLDVVVARKLPAPGNPELAVGAVAADGTVWLNDGYVADLGVDESYVEQATEREREAAARKLARYRGDRPAPDLAGKVVAVVDDGLATGATVRACVRQVRDAGAARVVVAVPVGPPDTVERLREEADEVVCVETPPHFGAVGQFYESFPQVSDEEAMGYLE
ncbi:phosphoribosyltransferase [Salinirussus salinus]|jgi:predicted phosphoribosyltransferase|uniref:phosphoribosyltransferase n=1 Tax=Salinirussus salinus TaxID=1198300 RepID=UPI00135A7104|nr:phosphoribosyltransferase family protein [Salinirussus salinus]